MYIYYLFDFKENIIFQQQKSLSTIKMENNHKMIIPPINPDSIIFVEILECF